MKTESIEVRASHALVFSWKFENSSQSGIETQSSQSSKQFSPSIKSDGFKVSSSVLSKLQFPHNPVVSLLNLLTGTRRVKP